MGSISVLLTCVYLPRTGGITSGLRSRRRGGSAPAARCGAPYLRLLPVRVVLWSLSGCHGVLLLSLSYTCCCAHVPYTIGLSVSNNVSNSTTVHHYPYSRSLLPPSLNPLPSLSYLLPAPPTVAPPTLLLAPPLTDTTSSSSSNRSRTLRFQSHRLSGFSKFARVPRTPPNYLSWGPTSPN
jgi:hypothetical protein